jgi:hypothetical protein
MPIRGSIANSLRVFGADRTGGMPRITTPVIDYVMVAGGGGGGIAGGGGGGGGGVLFGSYSVTPGMTLTFQVGGGGGGGSNGGDSILSGPGTPTITAVGGGHGGDSGSNFQGAAGGSGGGAGRDVPAPSAPTSYGAGTPGQGNKGGRGGSPPQGAAGGGGGANGGGQDGNSNPGQPYDNARNGGDGKSPIFDLGWPDVRTYLNAQGITGGGSWTAPFGNWNDYRLGSGGGNGIQRDGSQPAGLGGSGSSWGGYPHTGGDGGGGPGAAKAANSACAYTGSGGGGGAANPSPSPGGGSGSGGTLLIKFDASYNNVTSTTGGPLYAYQSGYYIFHFLGSGSITF